MQCAKAKEARVQQESLLSLRRRPEDATPSAGVIVRDRSTTVNMKYIEFEKALKAFRPYHPLSTTFFEPTNSSERFVWHRDLVLSFPIAIVRFPVGGSLGVLVWVMKRDEDEIALGDHEEIQSAMELVRPAIPNVSHTSLLQPNAHACTCP